jgi:alkylated DNA repair dioxygenase AlkB
MSKHIKNKRYRQPAKEHYDGRRDVQKLGSGDSFYISKFIKSRAERDQIFQNLLSEVKFVQMYQFWKDKEQNGEDKGNVEPIPRMVSAQTTKNKDVSPIYRMPGCNQKNIKTEPWTPTVQDICERASAEIDQELNHCVCTLYRDENDSLAYHTDKLLDLKDGTLILSVSFGAPRPILFSEIDGKKEQSLILQPGSLLAIGPKTNKRFKHGIPKLTEPTGPRISLSIRTIDTFMDESTGEVSGHGEEYQSRNYPFITSYDDVSQYTEEIQQQISQYAKESNQRLHDIRSAV